MATQKAHIPCTDVNLGLLRANGIIVNGLTLQIPKRYSNAHLLNIMNGVDYTATLKDCPILDEDAADNTINKLPAKVVEMLQTANQYGYSVFFMV